MTVIDASAGHKKSRGKIVRLSRETEVFLNRKRKGKEGYDAILRRLFGLPKIKGTQQPLLTWFVIPNGDKPIIELRYADARGKAIVLATQKGLKKAEAVIKVTEAR